MYPSHTINRYKPLTDVTAQAAAERYLTEDVRLDAEKTEALKRRFGG